MSLDQVTITNQGLLNINKKILDVRKFDNSLISTAGEITVEDSVASGFSSSNYLYKDNILFSSDVDNGKTVLITFEATYSTSADGHSQTGFMFNSTTGDSILFQFVEDCPQIVFPSGLTINFDYLTMGDGASFKLFLSITSEGCSATINIGTDVFTNNGTFSYPINLINFQSVVIGNNNAQESSSYWEGFINLAKFAIKEGTDVVYTPTVGYDFTFTHLALSDGKYELPEGYIPPNVIGHTYLYTIESNQITRSSNTLLITTEIGKDSKLHIRKIGIYAKSEDKFFLFGYIENLNIDKSSDVPYDLIISTNLSINTANVIGFPTQGSFFLEQIKPILLKDYTRVVNTNLYGIENIERMIRMNSFQIASKKGYSYDSTTKETKYCCDNPTSIQSIGYNTPQVVYKLQREIGEQEDCYSAIQTYSKLRKNFKKEIGVIFNKSSITEIPPNDEEGKPPAGKTLRVTDEGEASGFKLNPDNYISIGGVLHLMQDWEFNTSFYVSSSDSPRCILSLGNIYERHADVAIEGDEQADPAPVAAEHIPFVDLILNTSNELIASYNESSVKISDISYGTKYFTKLSYAYNEGNPTLSISVSTDKVHYSEPVVIDNLPTKELYTAHAIFPATRDDTKDKDLDGTTLYAWRYNESYVYTKSETITASTVLYNSDGSEYEGTAFYVGEAPDSTYVIYHRDEDPDSFYIINDMYAGVKVDYTITDNTTTVPATKIVTQNVSLPLEHGILYLADWNFIQENNNWYTTSEDYVYDNELLQYYHLSDYPILSYKISDICNSEYNIAFLDDEFKGNKDLIDFSKESFSLAIKVKLEDAFSKVLFAKVNENGDVLFKFEFLGDDQSQDNYYFKFSIAKADDTFDEYVSNPMAGENRYEYFRDSFLITLIKNEDGISFFINNQALEMNLVPQGTEENEGFPSYEGSCLTNYIKNVEPNAEDATPNSKAWVTGKYVQDIIFIDNAISSAQLYYITNLTDTNYSFSN